MMQTKAIIRFGELSVDLEGAEAFVSAQLERFASPLLEHARRAPAAPAPDEPDVPDQRPPVDTKQKRGRATSGSGQGCAKRVNELFADGFFKQARETGEIVTALKERATPYPANKISAGLINLAKRRKLRRFSEGGKWLYIVP